VPLVYLLKLSGDEKALDEIEKRNILYSEDIEQWMKRESIRLLRIEFETYESKSVENILKASKDHPNVRFDCVAFDRDDVDGASYWIQNSQINDLEEFSWRCGTCSYLHRGSIREILNEDEEEENAYYKCPKCGVESF
jgi:DNA-directed RNA polymerase subunit RPC12/RpoP